MKKLLIFLTTLNLSICALAQYEPLMVTEDEKLHPDSEFIVNNDIATGTQLSLKADASDLQNYALKSYVDGKFPSATLTRGTGLLGSNYNGSMSQSWSVDPVWIKNLQPTLTRGTGLTGSNYNGNTASSFAVDTVWLTQQIQTQAPKAKYPLIVVDTAPTYVWNSGTQKYDALFLATDAELKVPDDYGKTIYWFPTLINDAIKSSPKFDPNGKAWFMAADLYGIDARAHVPLMSNIFSSIAEQSKAMAGGVEYPEINGIEIQPNIAGTLNDGTKIDAIFNSNNKKLFISLIRFDQFGFEKSKAGNPKFRSSIPIFNYTEREFVPLRGINAKPTNGWVVTGTNPERITLLSNGFYLNSTILNSIPTVKFSSQSDWFEHSLENYIYVEFKFKGQAGYCGQTNIMLSQTLTPLQGRIPSNSFNIISKSSNLIYNPNHYGFSSLAVNNATVEQTAWVLFKITANKDANGNALLSFTPEVSFYLGKYKDTISDMKILIWKGQK